MLSLLRALSLALLAPGCTVQKAPSDLRDQDGDGYDGEEDCDDRNVDVHPDAAEVCDGLDQDCDGVVDEDAGSGWYLDEDGDGWGSGEPIPSCTGESGLSSRGEDCDDEDASVNPEQAERCDEVDNDCDSEVDEDAEDAMKAWVDRDGDGYGSPSVTLWVCVLEEGMVENAEDCKDSDPDVHPGAGELCDDDDEDEDCDGLVDDADPDATGQVALYIDLDGDGFGGEVTTMLACDGSAGLSTVGGDCDDLDPTLEDPQTFYEDVDGDGYGVRDARVEACWEVEGISERYGDCAPEDPASYPGAEEVWYDGVDQDCDEASDYDQDQDGYDAEAWGGEDCDDLLGTVTPDASEIWYDGIDQACDGGSDYDQDGDGYDSEDYGGEDCDDTDARALPGGAQVIFPGDWDCDGEDDLDGEVWTGSGTTWGRLGHSVAGVGDTNGDGLPDLMIGAPATSSETGAALLLGGPADQPLVGALAFITADLAGTSSLGERVFGVGDVDGDGYDDGVVSAITLPDGAPFAGGILLFEGPLEGEVASSEAASTLFGDEVGARLGQSVDAVDLDGDGTLELAVGEPAGGLSVDEGFVYLVAPESSGSMADVASVTIDGGWTTVSFGERVVSAGDTDGDGLEELAVTSLYGASSLGGIWLISGTLSGTELIASVGHWIGGLSPNDRTGKGLDGGVDANADGYDDLLIGAPRWEEGDASDVGVAWLLLGPLSDVSDVSDYVARFTGEEEWAELGSSVAFLGDRDGDGVEDIALGAPYATGDFTETGEVQVYSGAVEGDFTREDADVLLVGEASEMRVGVALDAPGDLDADGYTEVLAGGATPGGPGQVLLLRGAP